MDYFRSKSQKSPSARAPPLDSFAPGGWMFSPKFKFNNQKYVQDPTPILHTKPF